MDVVSVTSQTILVIASEVNASEDSAKPRKPLWKRLLKWGLWIFGGLVLILLLLAGTGWWLWSSGRLVPLVMQFQLKNAQGKIDPLERPWPDTNAVGRSRPPLRRDAAAVRTAAEFYQPSGIWEAHLRLNAEQWRAMQPTPVRARPMFDVPDGKFSLSNTNASRNGLLGAIGLDLDWTTARLEFGGMEFTNVAVRFKGNGTFLGAIGGVKKPLKVDLGREVKGRTLAGVQVLNFGNLNGDFSCLSDTMAYEFFRAAGVPASRSTLGHVTLTVENLWEARPFGLYVMVENIDAAFARERFGTDKMGLFKPVTYSLFDYLGEDWEAYRRIYDPKLPLTDDQKRRVIDTAKLVTQSTDEDFARRASEFFDFEEVARFVAVNSLLSSYDGFLNNGQNFFMYLDPRSDRFGFLPWDLDRAWGEFPFTGTLEDKEQASIERPWIADHRLLERLFAVPAFKELYRQRLGEIFRAHFVPTKLAARVDELAPIVRPGLVDESELRQAKFEESIMDSWRAEKSSGIADMSPQRPAHQLKRFFVRRHEHVAAQLGGREEGVIFHDRKMQPQK